MYVKRTRAIFSGGAAGALLRRDRLDDQLVLRLRIELPASLKDSSRDQAVNRIGLQHGETRQPYRTDTRPLALQQVIRVIQGCTVQQEQLRPFRIERDRQGQGRHLGSRAETLGQHVVIVLREANCAWQAFSPMRNRRSPEFFHLGRILFQEAVQLLLGSGHGDKIVSVYAVWRQRIWNHSLGRAFPFGSVEMWHGKCETDGG